MALAAVVVFCFIGRDWLNGLTLDVLHYFEAPAHVSTGKPYGEYRLFEVVSRWFPLVAMMLFVDVYLHGTSRHEIRLALVAGFFALAMYAAESNFVIGRHPMWIGTFFGGCLLLLLWPRRQWLLLGVLAAAGVAMQAGHIGDWCSNHCNEIGGLSDDVAYNFRMVEEELEMLGAALYLLFALMCWAAAGRAPSGRHLLARAAWLVPPMLVAYGNSLQHYQRDPSHLVLKFALFTVLAGAAALLWRLRGGRRELDAPRAALSFVFAFIFIVMPAIYGNYSAKISTVHVYIWVPLLICLYRYLVHRPPMVSADTRA